MKPCILSSLPVVALKQLGVIALDSGQIAQGIVSGHHILAVPDVIVVEYEAHGRPLPPAPRVQRRDGREVAFYRLPEVAA